VYDAVTIPGRLATLATCSATLSSIASSRSRDAKITPGTRMRPMAGSSHSKSPRRFSLEMFIACLRMMVSGTGRFHFQIDRDAKTSRGQCK
jgi:hypothetical protein